MAVVGTLITLKAVAPTGDPTGNVIAAGVGTYTAMGVLMVILIAITSTTMTAADGGLPYTSTIPATIIAAAALAELTTMPAIPATTTSQMSIDGKITVISLTTLAILTAPTALITSIPANT